MKTQLLVIMTGLILYMKKGHFPVSEYTNFINMCKEWQGHNGAVIDTFIPKMIRDSFGKVRPPLKP